jgi:cell division cycle 20-like protein 1 (cofactor of APC complex)
MLRSKNRQSSSDRFITARSRERDILIQKYNLTEKTPNMSLTENEKTKTAVIIKDKKQVSDKIYLSLLKTQLFSTNEKQHKTAIKTPHTYLNKKRKIFFSKEFFSENSPSISRKLCFDKKHKIEDDQDYSSFKDLIDFNISQDELKNIPTYNKKNISTNAYKMLDAPGLRNDFYVHLLDWSSTNLLAVGLEENLYLWEGNTCKVKRIGEYDKCVSITSVGWMPDGDKLIVGLLNGEINVYDIETNKIINTYSNNRRRVGVLSPIPTEKNIFSSGSLGCDIITYDIRSSNPVNCMVSHTQEVCGLKWSNDGRLLASGGNDNKLMVWSLRKHLPESKFQAHNSAVRAIGWSHHKKGILASGGGTQDRTIKFWNTNEMKLVDSIDTTSQVCDLTFSKISNEFISTHGYTDNLILLWDSNNLEVISTLKGHKERVIYLSTGPDNANIVTGAGDETIRFWKVFSDDHTEHQSPKLKNIYIR